MIISTQRIRLNRFARLFLPTFLNIVAAAAYPGEAPKWMRTRHLEWSIGVLHRAGDVRPFLTTLT